jgi:hypothetical protein
VPELMSLPLNILSGISIETDKALITGVDAKSNDLKNTLNL